MKKFYSMLMLASVLSSFAGETSRITVSTEPLAKSHKQFVIDNNVRPHKTVARANSDSQVILTPPADAEIKMYTRTTSGYSVRWGSAYQEYDEGIVGEIAYCENGDVYLKNPMSFYITDSWIKGKKEGNQLTFTFPQLVAQVPGDDLDPDSEIMDVWLNVLSGRNENGQLTFERSEDTPNAITMTIDDNGNLVYAEEMTTGVVSGDENYSYPKRMLALTNSDSFWLGYGDYDNLYEPFNDKPLLIPENLEKKAYAMVYGDEAQNGKWVNMAFDDSNSKIYISGIYSPSDKGYENLAKSAIVGTLLDGGAMFQSRQYVGIDPYYYHSYVSGGKIVREPSGIYLDIEDIYYMTSTSDRTKYTSGSTLVVSEGENQGYVLDTFYYPVFDSQNGYVDPNPAEPLVTGFMPWTPGYGYGGVKVMIPNTNKNGQLLHTEDLSYSIIINDKQIVFDPENYEGFTEATPWIPFNFSSYDVEIDPYTVNTRMVFMGDELMDVHTISVQSRYKYGDSYYVTNGMTYTYKDDAFEAPTFSPESGHVFTEEPAEVTITAPNNAFISYRVITDEDPNPEFTVAEYTNTVTLTLTGNCMIQAMSVDPEGDDELTSSVATASYTIDKSGVASITADSEAEFFTISGVRVDRENLVPGLYIVKSGTNARSVKIK